MKAAEQTLHRNLQHIELCDVELHAAVGNSGKRTGQLNGQRDDLVHGAVQLELLALWLERDTLERRIGRRACVEVVGDISDIGANDPFLNLKDKGIRVVKRWSDLFLGTKHLSANPADIDAEVRAFPQEQIMCVDEGRRQIVGRRIA